MRDHRPTLTEQLISDSKLSEIQKHASEILRINEVINQIVPKHAVGHCRAANIRGSHLIIEVASAALKMKLDYDRLNILSQLRNHGFARLISLELKINPSLYKLPTSNTEKSENDIPPRPPISHNAAQALLMIAESAPPKIKKRLEQLALLAEKNN